jgi:hypothetical protein
VAALDTGGRRAGARVELSAFICGDARVTHDGRMDVLGVLNELYAPAFPARQDRVVLVALLVWDAGESGALDFRVDLEDDAGASIYTVTGSTDVAARDAPSPPPKTRLVLPLHNVVFPAAGRYRFVLRVASTRVLGPSLFVCEQAQQ